MRRQRQQHRSPSSSPDGEAAAPSSPWGPLLPPPLPPRRRCRASPAGTASRGPARQRTGAGWCLGAAVRSRCFPWPRRWPGCGPRRRGLEREREIREKVAKVEGQKKRLLTKQPPLFPFLFLSLSLSLSYLSRRPAYGKEPMLSHCCPLERGVAVRGPERKRPAEKRASLEERLSFFVG